MTAISKNLYIHKFPETVKRYNNTVHKTLQIKPIVKIDSYTEFSNEFNIMV